MDTQRLVTTKPKLKSTHIFLVAGAILVSLLISVLCIGLTVHYEVDTEVADVKSVPYWKTDLPSEQDLWYEKGIEELKSVIVKREQRGQVENVLIFMAEGVNGDMLAKSRFVKNKNSMEMKDFIWDSFPHMGILKSSLKRLTMDTQRLVTTKPKLKSTHIFLVAGAILVSLLISVLCIGLTVHYEVDTEVADVKSVPYWKTDLPSEQDLWYEKGIEELKSVIVKREQRGQVENVLIFMAEGVNGDMLAKSRFVKNKNSMEMKDFIWDSFPHMGILKSDCSLKENCDLFTLATALFGGVKTSKGLGGLDRRVEFQNCYQALNNSFHIKSIFHQAKAMNLNTGFVTTRQITGPLMAGLYAHSSNTEWECDTNIPNALKTKCQDLASQLIKSKEARNINVIMGRDRQSLLSEDPDLKSKVCRSLEHGNLLKDYLSYMKKQNSSFQLLQTPTDLNEFQGSEIDYMRGVFNNGDISNKVPNLTAMVTKAMDVLNRKNKGYLFVAHTAVENNEVEKFQEDLWELDETIRETFRNPGFTTSNTVVLTVFLDFDSQSPNDILLYAKGPQSYLFHGLHEETYMAHVIAYYLKTGVFQPLRKLKKEI